MIVERFGAYDPFVLGNNHCIATFPFTPAAAPSQSPIGHWYCRRVNITIIIFQYLNHSTPSFPNIEICTDCPDFCKNEKSACNGWTKTKKTNI